MWYTYFIVSKFCRQKRVADRQYDAIRHNTAQYGAAKGRANGQMEYKIAICDDMKKEREYLCALVRDWAKRSGRSALVFEFSSAEAFLFEYPEEKDFDILLLDIMMKEMDGLELARKIRKTDCKMQIIFITGVPDFIAEGYEVSALNYLVKPVDPDKLWRVLDRAANGLQKSEKVLKIPLEDQKERCTLFVPLSSIVYVEAQKQFVLISVRDEKGKENVYKTKRTLAETEKDLDPFFFRCHRSYIVNLRYVSKLKRNAAVLNDNKEIPVSRSMKKSIADAIIKLF